MSERVEDTYVSLEIEWQWTEIHRHDEELPFSGQILFVPTNFGDPLAGIRKDVQGVP